MRTKIALLFAVVLGILAVLGIQAYLSGREEQIDKGKELVGIAIAKEMLPAGTDLLPSQIAERRVDAAAVTDAHIVWDQATSYVNRKVMRRVPANSALLKDYFMPTPTPGDIGDKKVDLKMRAITIGTDQIAGVAGLITPGSTVDILCTFRFTGKSPESAATIITKVISRNVQIMAVDNRTDVYIPVRAGRAATPFDQGYSSVTVHVLPIEASLLVFAQQTGKLTFALRNRKDTDYQEVNDITLAEFDAIIAEAARQRKDRLERQPKPSATP